MCMERDINGLNYEKEEPNVQIAHAVHRLRGNTPLFYWLTKSFYAEDMIDIIEAVQQGKPVPALDLEEDILHGIMIQFALIVTVLGVAIVLMMRFISGRLWQPFDKTLEAIEHFKLHN